MRCIGLDLTVKGSSGLERRCQWRSRHGFRDPQNRRERLRASMRCHFRSSRSQSSIGPQRHLAKKEARSVLLNGETRSVTLQFSASASRIMVLSVGAVE